MSKKNHKKNENLQPVHSPIVSVLPNSSTNRETGSIGKEIPPLISVPPAVSNPTLNLSATSSKIPSFLKKFGMKKFIAFMVTVLVIAG